MLVYKLTEDERQAFEILSASSSNVNACLRYG